MKKLFVAVTFFFCASVQAETVDVTTHSGVLVGKVENGIHVFNGVPYAKPPVGELRWRPPQPTVWTGKRQAFEFALPCLQPTYADRVNGGGVSGESSEDCLYLNLWTKADNEKAPVMVWLYGGGGVVGAGSVPTYDGSAFARDGVVLITINYRLGALAGFAHPALTQEARAKGEPFGNYHLLDAIAALQWARKNAEAFGGDPDNIIVFGESAGATMTANLLTSPLAKNTFDKAIVESTGSLPTPGTPLNVAEQRGVALMAELGLSEKASLADMRALPARDIISQGRLGRGIRTIIDGSIKTQSIMEAFAAGQENDVPFILGTNSDEGRLMGTQKVASFAQDGAPVWQYFFDYVPNAFREAQPNGAPHAAEIPYVFDTLAKSRGAERMSEKDFAVAAGMHSCWVAFVKMPRESKEIRCADGFVWPARSDANQKTVALLQATFSLGRADDLRSPPNGAEPGPTSRP